MTTRSATDRATRADAADRAAEHDLDDAAAVIAVLAGLAAARAAEQAPPAAASCWGDPALRLRAATPTTAAGPGGWWASGLPR